MEPIRFIASASLPRSLSMTNPAAPICNNRRPACHGLRHDKPERLFPFDGIKERFCRTVEIGKLFLGEFPDVGDALVEVRFYDVIEVLLLRWIDAPRKRKLDAERLGRSYGVLNSFMLVHASNPREVVTGSSIELEMACVAAVINDAGALLRELHHRKALRRFTYEDDIRSGSFLCEKPQAVVFRCVGVIAIEGVMHGVESGNVAQVVKKERPQVEVRVDDIELSRLRHLIGRREIAQVPDVVGPGDARVNEGLRENRYDPRGFRA